MTQVDTAQSFPTNIRYGDDVFIDAYGAAWGDAESIVSFFAEDSTYEDKTSGVVIRGHDMMRRFMKVYLRFSPMSVVTFTRVVMGPNSFAAEWMWTGTGDGELRLPDGVTAANGTAFDVPGMSMCTVDDDGLIASHTDYWDAATLMRQLGT